MAFLRGLGGSTRDESGIREAFLLLTKSGLSGHSDAQTQSHNGDSHGVCKVLMAAQFPRFVDEFPAPTATRLGQTKQEGDK
jgi:hypothetical protein